MRKIAQKFSFLIPVITFAVIMVFMAGCAKKTEKNKAIALRGFEEVWNQGNLDVVDEIYAIDYVGYMPGSLEIQGTEGFKQFVNMYRTAFPDIKFTIEDQIAEGDKVVTRWTGTGTLKGELMGIPPTGVQVTSTGIDILRFAGGKIVEVWVNMDDLGMLQQLGVVPAEELEDFTWGKPSEVTGKPGDPEENKAIVRRGFEEVWNQKKLDVIDEILAADYVGHMPGSPELQGTEDYKQFVTMYQNAFPDNQFTIEDQITEGDKVVTRWTASGTHKGELMGIPPTGLKSTVAGITIDRIAGGKIVEEWTSWDTLGMLQQLGVIPPMGQGEE